MGGYKRLSAVSNRLTSVIHHAADRQQDVLWLVPIALSSLLTPNTQSVRLGSSGLMVSKFILGCSGYGTPEWYDWVKGEVDSIRDIKAASVVRLTLL